MRIMSDEEKNRLSQLGQKHSGEWKKYRDDMHEKLSEEVKKLADYAIKTSDKKPALYIMLCNGLADGTYKKPSEFFEKNAAELFNGWIFPRRKKQFYYAVDHLHEWIYSTSIFRRSLRTNNPQIIAYRILNVMYSFHHHDRLDADICDMLEDKLSDEMLGHKLFNYYYSYESFIAYPIAAEIDSGNERLINLITDTINGQNDVMINRGIFLGIFRSHNHELHALMGRLLEAARLQEGLRQAICESMDEGTPEGFLAILDVIYKNNYIRFSSVKRAVGTWLGLINEETAKVERISDKSIELIYNVLTKPNVKDEYLASEDSMKIHIALWAYGFYETDDLVRKTQELVQKGTRHQVLTASYMLMQLNRSQFMHWAAYCVIPKYADDNEILAAYTPCLMNDVREKIQEPPPSNQYVTLDDYILRAFFERKCCDLSVYFESAQAAESCYDLLKGILSTFKGKEQIFSPCIFPWHTVRLSRNDIIIRMAYIASGLKSNEKIDDLCSLLSDVEAYDRQTIVDLLLIQPETKIQRETLIAALCDKAERTRKTAFRLIKLTELFPEDYLKIEDMLRYKAADARANIISLLYAQNDDALLATVSRLVSTDKEEKRTAALDMIISLSNDEKRSELFSKCRTLAESISKPTSKEKILIERILNSNTLKADKQKKLFEKSDKYIPDIPANSFTEECIDLFMKYFPDSEIGTMLIPKKYKSFSGSLKKASEKLTGTCISYKQAQADCESLCKFIEEHEHDEFRSSNGEITIVGCEVYRFTERTEDNRQTVALYPLWKEWFDTNISSAQRLMQMFILAGAYSKVSVYTETASRFIQQLYGVGFDRNIAHKYALHMADIVQKLVIDLIPDSDRKRLAVAVALWYLNCVPTESVFIDDEPDYNKRIPKIQLISHTQIGMLLYRLRCENNDDISTVMPLTVGTMHKSLIKEKNLYYFENKALRYPRVSHSSRFAYRRFEYPTTKDFIIGAYHGVISERALYEYLFDKDHINDTLGYITNLIIAVKEKDKQISQRGRCYLWRYNRQLTIIRELTGKEDNLSDNDNRLIELGVSVYYKMINHILSAELRRGDTPTEYSENIRFINRIYGLDNFIAILCAMGKDTFDRSTYSLSGTSKKETLSMLLSVCIPNDDDNAERLGKLLESTDISQKRLIEAALYSPEWIGIVDKYLGWDGFTSACYYFMAHMNERFDDRRRAVIAKYTPLTVDELNAGAFDINWFKSAYETIGKKRFDMIYDAAKYISDGSKHSRARKYADAVLGKYDTEKTAETISDKRNKDLLMAYSLIPLSGEDDICNRYLFLQKFLKESKKFGSQRSASEKKAVEIAMQNLATNAGYADVTRLTLRMEAKLIDDSRELFEDRQIDDITIRLSVDSNGKTEVITTKNGKALKAVPAKLKKNEYILKINQAKKNLTEQYRRTKAMFEQAMEDSTEFSVYELKILSGNPVVYPLIKNLVFSIKGRLGFLDGNRLTDYSGGFAELSDDDMLCIAHTFMIYSDGHLSDYQKYLFDSKTVQPFKQVFRELYVKTADEIDTYCTRRYSGNQIQPAKAFACLKARRWIADIENGLQKVFYKEDIVAKIFSLADWFSPSDIEAPTIEWVGFFDRKTGEPLNISNVPDIIFSEIMRDTDMAVSVAHAGGVDPETSHSTIEMRAALVEFTLPLFRLKNVRVEKNHAHIEGKLGNYSVHLGSGVIHKMGGTMINILPVHSQHRGKLFLPFADEDPKTAEILTKILFLSEDSKIKDPSIISQINA